MDKAKSYRIPKQLVWEAFKLVKANKGSAGVDAETIADFERDLKRNLYKVWNRMSAGSYMPPPVRVVEIPKGDGGKRKLGIPTVADRVAQTVCKRVLEKEIELIFHTDSYAYRPNKTALEAVGKARERCWRLRWVLDLDIKGFFDAIDHELMMKAVRKHTKEKWVILYVERWLKAKAQLPTGAQTDRDKGTPQGGVVSPILANLFLHYAFDMWMQRNYPGVPFERYADDIIAHCSSEQEAEELRSRIAERLGECKLQLHPDKTKVVYCNNGDGKKGHNNGAFDFLGYTFRPRRIRTKQGKMCLGFLPAVSDKAAKAIRQEIREWQVHRRTGQTLESIADYVNPRLRGWANYYGKFYGSKLRYTLGMFNFVLMRWAMNKFRRLRARPRRAVRWLKGIAQRQPNLFHHWQMGVLPSIEQ
jgi:RNA-directed DNA polymerase